MNTRDLIGTRDTAAILGVTPARVRALQQTYRLGILVSGRWLFERTQIIAFSKKRPGRKGGRPKVAP